MHFWRKSNLPASEDMCLRNKVKTSQLQTFKMNLKIPPAALFLHISSQTTFHFFFFTVRCCFLFQSVNILVVTSLTTEPDRKNTNPQSKMQHTLVFISNISKFPSDLINHLYSSRKGIECRTKSVKSTIPGIQRRLMLFSTAVAEVSFTDLQIFQHGGVELSWKSMTSMAIVLKLLFLNE